MAEPVGGPACVRACVRVCALICERPSITSVTQVHSETRAGTQEPLARARRVLFDLLELFCTTPCSLSDCLSFRLGLSTPLPTPPPLKTTLHGCDYSTTQQSVVFDSLWLHVHTLLLTGVLPRRGWAFNS